MVVAVVTIGELNGVSPGTPTNNVTHINMTSTEEVNSDAASNVIIAGNNSYEKCNYIYLSGINDSNLIDNFKWWMTPSTPETGIAYKTNVKTTPMNDDSYPAGGLLDTISTIATLAMPTAEPGTENIGVSGGSGGLDTDTTRSDLIFAQLQSTGSADPGDVITKTFHGQYDEQ